MKGEQLELNLWEELRRTQQRPEAVQVAQMLDVVERTDAELPEAERLRVAGDALLQIAEVCAARADVLMAEWEEAYRDPIVQQEFFTELVRQTMAVDLSELMEPIPPRQPRSKRAKSTKTEEGSILVTVDKAAVLAMVDQWEAEAAVEEERKQQVLASGDEEAVSQWIEAITGRLQALPTHQTSFAELCQGLELPRVEVWLGVLLGEFELQPDEEFYSDALGVKAAADTYSAT